jgi:hypothetical protein
VKASLVPFGAKRFNVESDPKRELLRHALATIAYRGGKAARDAPETFGTFKVDAASRTPARILAHIGDLLDWALSMARGQQEWHDSKQLEWDREVSRFFETLGRFDAYLASNAPLACSAEKIFQGPVADALTHVGQIAMLRRLAGAAMKGENYFEADIVAGRVGAEQTAPRDEFG